MRSEVAVGLRASLGQSIAFGWFILYEIEFAGIIKWGTADHNMTLHREREVYTLDNGEDKGSCGDGTKGLRGCLSILLISR